MNPKPHPTLDDVIAKLERMRVLRAVGKQAAIKAVPRGPNKLEAMRGVRSGLLLTRMFYLDAHFMEV